MPRNSSADFERAALASRLYFSRSTRTASGFTRPVGCEPALNVSNRPRPICRSKYSPRTERAELPVHRMRTLSGGLGGGFMGESFLRGAVGGRAAAGAGLGEFRGEFFQPREVPLEDHVFLRAVLQ